MKKTIRYLALLLAILCVITGAATIASATADGESPDPGIIDDPGNGNDPGNGDDPGDGEDPYTGNDPVDGDDPIGGDDPYTGDDPVGGDDPYTGDDPVDGDEPISGYDPDYDEPDDNWRWDDPDYSYSGDGSGNAGSVADANTLVETKEINKDDIAPNQWSNIAISEDSVKKQGDSSLSFASIKTDDGSDPNDNGGWILWIGYGLIALAVLGILYFIVATVNAKKMTKREERHNAGSRGSGSRGSGSGRRSAAPAGHYADGYESSSRRSSKADTGEVYIPRRVAK